MNALSLRGRGLEGRIRDGVLAKRIKGEQHRHRPSGRLSDRSHSHHNLH